MFVGGFVKDRVVLDSGCGYGYGSRYLADQGADFVVATDRDGNAVKLAKSWYGADNLDFVVADGNHMPFCPCAFDTTSSLEVIEHIEDYEGYVREIYRVLRDNGSLILSTPNKSHTDRTRLMPLFHIREFYPNLLVSLLGKYFTVLHLYGKNIVTRRTTVDRSSDSIHVGLILAKAASIKGVRMLLQRLPNHFLSPIRFILRTNGVPELKPEDFEISESIVPTASNLIAVCTKG
jgi:SAM-dependent methyltransferase